MGREHILDADGVKVDAESSVFLCLGVPKLNLEFF